MLQSRRQALRNATARAHVDLERTVGGLSSRTTYVNYVRGLLAFRRPIEGALKVSAVALTGVRPTEIADLLVQDLEDLQAETLPDEPFALAFDMAGVLGTLYVLEGSGLGARVLIRDALKLGLNQSYGARHLARQALSLEAWHALLAKIEHANHTDVDRIADAANLVFDAAQRAMVRARDAGH